MRNDDPPTNPPVHLPPPPGGRPDSPPDAGATVDLHSWLEQRRQRAVPPEVVAAELRTLGWVEPGLSGAVSQYVRPADQQPMAWWSLYAGVGLTALAFATFVHLAVDGLSTASRGTAALSVTTVILAAPFAAWGFVTTRRRIETSPVARFSPVRRSALDALLWSVFVISILRLLVYVFQLAADLLDVDGAESGSSFRALVQAVVTLAVAGPLWVWGWQERRDARPA